MNKYILNTFILCCLSFLLVAQQRKFDVSIFPKPEKGFKKLIIHLPTKSKEENYKVEVFAGIEEKVDCNQYHLIGEIKTMDLPGWGYTYYKVESDAKMAGTLMGCIDYPKRIKFIHLQPILYSYNSKLPMVFYVPEKFIIRYKIFQASAQFVEIK